MLSQMNFARGDGRAGARLRRLAIGAQVIDLPHKSRGIRRLCYHKNSPA